MELRKRMETMCSRAALLLLCVLMADCCLFGGGRLLSAGPVGFRMAVLFAFMLACFPSIVRQRRALVRSGSLWSLVCFAAWLGVEAYLGVQNGNRMPLILTDVKGFVYFAAVPALMAALEDRARVHTLQKVMMYAAALLAAGEIALLGLYLAAPQSYLSLSEWLNARQVSMLGVITQRIPRLFMKSSMYLVCGCAFAVYFQSREDRLRIRYLLVTGGCLFALLLTYTRSIYLGALVTAAVLLVCVACAVDRAHRIRVAGHVGGGVAILLALVLIFSLAGRTNYMGYAFSRVSTTFEQHDEEPPAAETQQPGGEVEQPEPPASLEKQEQESYNALTMDSDALRDQTLAELRENIRRSPVTGLGLGAAVAVREDGLNEYFYLDLLSKTGVIGLALYLLPVLLMAIRLVQARKSEGFAQCAAWFSVLLGFLVFSYFNPYMNASLGILMYGCCLAVFRCELKSV